MRILAMLIITDHGHTTKFNQPPMSKCMLVTYVSELTNLYTECIIFTQTSRKRIGIGMAAWMSVT